MSFERAKKHDALMAVVQVQMCPVKYNVTCALGCPGDVSLCGNENCIFKCQVCGGVDGQWTVQQDWVSYTKSDMSTGTESARRSDRRARWQPKASRGHDWPQTCNSWDDYYRFAEWQPGEWYQKEWPRETWTWMTRCRSTNEAKFIPMQPNVVGLVAGRGGENLKRLKQLPDVESIEVYTNDADGQFEGRIHKQAGLVVIATPGAFQRVEREVRKIEHRQEVEISNLPHEKMLQVVMPVAFQNLTFVKADMNKCIAHFAPFQNREYFELRGLQHGLDEPENSPRIRNISIETDCAALAKRFQELLPIWMEQNGAGVRIEVVIRLGCLRYFGKRNTCKGVLSREQFGKLRPKEDFVTQFSRHLKPQSTQNDVLHRILKGVSDAAWTQKELDHTVLRFGLKDVASDLPGAIEIMTSSKLDPKSAKKLPRHFEITEKKSVQLHADADFVSAPIGFRVHVASDVIRSDLRRKFGRAKLERGQKDLV
eukprot:symbB.v1.2.006669.t1/scaffold372.1/size218212/21